MTIRKLERSEWFRFCAFASRYMIGKCADIEALSLRTGHRVSAREMPIRGIDFDPRRDLMAIHMIELDYLIYRPREMYVDDRPCGLASLSLIDADGTWEILVLREPRMLPAPGHSRAASYASARDSAAPANRRPAQFEEVGDENYEAFIDKQYRYLIELRRALLAAATNLEDDETSVNSDAHGAAWEFEDDAQRLAILEVDGRLIEHDVVRLNRVERALRKIEEGTYGFSDISSEPIPKERLEAIPEAICTFAEEKAFEVKPQL